MTGRKTHEQFVRNLERKPDMPDAQQDLLPEPKSRLLKRDGRQSEFPVSRHGLNQESEQAKPHRAPKGPPKH